MTTVNLQNNEVRLVFMNNRGEKESFIMDSKNSNPLAGEVIFTIPQEAASRILEFTNKSFWINSYVNGLETVIYQGTFDDSANQEKWLEAKEKENRDIENKKEELNRLIEKAKEAVTPIVISQPNASAEVSALSKDTELTLSSNPSIDRFNVIPVKTIDGIQVNGEVISEKKIDKIFSNSGITVRDIAPVNDVILPEKITNDMVKDSNIKTVMKKTQIT